MELLSQAWEAFKKEEYQHAITLCSEIISRDSTCTEAILLKAQSALFSENPAQAIAEAEKVLSTEAVNDKDKSLAFTIKADALRYNRQDDEAAYFYHLAIEADPSNHQAYHNRGNYFFLQGAYSEALYNYNLAIAYSTGSAVVSIQARSQVFYLMKLYDDALADIDKAIALQPDASQAYALKCNILLEQKHISQALTAVNQAIKLEPQEGKFYCQRGIVLNKIQMKKDACMDFHKALQLGFDDAASLIATYCS